MYTNNLETPSRFLLHALSLDRNYVGQFVHIHVVNEDDDRGDSPLLGKRKSFSQYPMSPVSSSNRVEAEATVSV